MGISFFSTRIILDKLGASDYGLNNIISGFVSMFTVMNGILQTGTRRFLALNIGKGDSKLLKKTFSTAFIMHLTIAFLIVITLEICGPWYIIHKLNIDPERIWAAQWVFQFAVLGVFMGVTQTPYVAAITSHEKFKIYAYMSVYDVIAKLFVLSLLVFIPYDKLVVYAFLTLLINITSIIIYRIYSIRNFPECIPSLKIDRSLCKEMLQFSGWTVLGNITVAVNGQGTRMLLNAFYTTSMNAAEGLASTVSFTIGQFIGGFTVAADPQLIKYYGAGEKKHFDKLIFNVTQYTLFIVAFIAVPVFMELDYVLKLWLTEVPPYTAEFVKVGLICNLIHSSNRMIDSGLVAAGYAKQLNTISIPLYLLSLPLVWFVLYMHWNPTFVYFAGTVPAVFAFIANLWLLTKYTNFDGKKYFFQIFIKNCALIAAACIPPLLVQSIMKESLVRFITVCSTAVLSTVLLMYFGAMNKEVRTMIKHKIIKNKASNKNE